MRGINKLTDRTVAAANKVGRYGDGGGLWLEVGHKGSKCWLFRYMMMGKARHFGLGPVATVSLAEARVRARQARQLVLDGKDPIDAKKEHAAATKVAQLKVMTFREATAQFLATSKIENFKNAKHRAQWRSTLERYAFPVLGDLPLQAIDTALVLKVLTPVWTRTPETGSRLRGRIERVIAWAKPLGLYEGENPASRDLLKDHVPARAKAVHHAALPYGELATLMTDLRDRGSISASALSLPF